MSDFATRDYGTRLKQDQAEERRALRALKAERAKLGPTPRIRYGPQLRKDPTADQAALDLEISRVERRIKVRSALISGRGWW